MDTLSGLNEGLVIYLPVKESSGSTLKNYGSCGGVFTLSNPLVTIAGKYGNGINLNSCSVTNSSAYTYISGQEMTLSFWLHMNTASLSLLTTDGGNVGLYPVTTSNTIIRFEINGSDYDTAPVQNNIWYYITVTCDGTTVKVYRNGEKDSSRNQSPFTARKLLTFGNADCYIDELRIYNRALSEKEISALMDIGME
jgi:hypothetical protein